MDSIICPNCKKPFQATQALMHQLEEKIKLANDTRHKEQLEKVKAQTEAETEKRLKEESQKELQRAKEEKEKLEEKLLKQKTEREEFEKKVQEDAKKSAAEEINLDMKMVKKQLEDAKEAERKVREANEDLKRKLNQTSQQLQGEVLELDLEEKLKLSFPYDEFKSVAKGREGADLIQYVRNKFGKIGSIILWEFKRTKNWDGKKWLPKLRENQRNANANESILVSETLPDGINVYEKIEGVWITSRKYAIFLAKILREMGLRIAIAKSGAQHTDGELKKLHEYILSEKFRHKIDRHREQTEMAIQILEKRKKDDEKYYRDQKLLLDRLATNTPQIYFDLQEILPTLPSITTIEPEYLSEENKSFT